MHWEGEGYYLARIKLWSEFYDSDALRLRTGAFASVRRNQEDGLGGQGRYYAERFKKMLRLYPHPSGRVWRGKDFEEATNDYVVGSYVTALRKGRIDNPGVQKLKKIAEVMGAPFELWLEEPEDWERDARTYLEPKRSMHSPPEAPGSEEEAETSGSSTLAGLLNRLFEEVRNGTTGEPYTNREVSALTQGRLSEDEVRRMREDDLENPTRGQLLALSDAFDIDPSYWFGRGSRRPVLNPDLAEALKDDRNYALLHKSLGLRDSDKDIVMVLMEQLRGREEPDKR